MNAMSHRTIMQERALFALLIASLLFLPLAIHAQATSSNSSSDLHAAIQSAVLSDPRSASVPPAQLNAMIDALTAQAQAQGMTAQQITWRGQTVAPNPQVSSCTSLLCSVSDAFGYDGLYGPFLFLVLILSGAIVLLLAWKLRRHHLLQHAQMMQPVPVNQTNITPR